MLTKKDMLDSVYRNNEDYAKRMKSFSILKKIINSMDLIDRKFFAGKENEDSCYDDEALSIGYNQTISQPTTVARMLLMSRLKPRLNVLEIGSGSGWNAALMASIVKPGKVISTERIKELKELAQSNLNKFMKEKKTKLNVEFLHTDTFDRSNKLWKMRYDRIMSTAGANIDLISQLKNIGNVLLKNNGLLVYPTNESGFNGALEIWKKQGEKLKRINREEGYSFVPLLKGI